MKDVVLVGGPYDGLATQVTDDLPVYWRIPHMTAFAAIVRPLATAPPPIQSPSYEISLYRRVQMSWGTPTKVHVYVHEREEP